MNTIKTQARTNSLIVKFLTSKGFTPVVVNGVVIVGAIKIGTISDAIRLTKHADNSTPCATSGHIDTNGGLRGHSVGDIYPWRIMAKGTFKELFWLVITPDGQPTEHGYRTAGEAYDIAAQLKGAQA